MLTASRLKDLLSYDPVTGEFRWRRPTSNRVRAGQVAGAIQANGYRYLGVDNQDYKASRLAWLYMTEQQAPRYIDHVNRNRADDSWENLRAATHSQNAANSRPRNATGRKGVTYVARVNRYMASITANGKSRYLGMFGSAEEAERAYLAAAKQIFGEFAYSGAQA